MGGNLYFRIAWTYRRADHVLKKNFLLLDHMATNHPLHLKKSVYYQNLISAFKDTEICEINYAIVNKKNPTARSGGSFDCTPIHTYLRSSPIVLNGIYFKVDMHRPEPIIFYFAFPVIVIVL